MSRIMSRIGNGDEWWVRLRLMPLIRYAAYAVLVMLIMGCHAKPKFVAVGLEGVNHTSDPVRYFSVNGYGGPSVPGYGEGGGYCCIAMPVKWRPGMQVYIEWEVNIAHWLDNTFPGFSDSEKYRAWRNELVEGRRKRSAVVDVPEYGNRVCAMEVNFIPCGKVEVTNSCWAWGSPNSPIKYPQKMEEPATCTAL